MKRMFRTQFTESLIKTLSVPNVMHFYWGNSTLSFVRFLTLYTASVLNPSWTLKLHVPKVKDSKFTHTSSEQRRQSPVIDSYHLLSTIPNLTVITHDFEELGIDVNLSDIYKSDIIRWKLLGEEGGVWCDMDIIFHKPLEILLCASNVSGNFAVCKYHKIEQAYPIGFLLAGTNCTFYKELYQQAITLMKSSDVENYQKYGTHIFTKLVKSYPQQPTWFFAESVYPVLPIKNEIERMHHNNSSGWITDLNIGLHWFGGHAAGDVVESQLSPTNYHKYGAISQALIAFERNTKKPISNIKL